MSFICIGDLSWRRPFLQVGPKILGLFLSWTPKYCPLLGFSVLSCLLTPEHVCLYQSWSGSDYTERMRWSV
jgi:hypothetical protein